MKWIAVTVLACIGVAAAILVAGVVSRVLGVPFKGEESRQAARTPRGLVVRFSALFTVWLFASLAVGLVSTYPTLSWGRPVWRTLLDSAVFSVAVWPGLGGSFRERS